MTSHSLRIEGVRVKCLNDFAERFFRSPVGQIAAPITVHRALAHSINPCADGDDVGLLIVYSGDLCVGYFGIVPGILKEQDRKKKVYFGSTFYVVPEFRRTTAALMLVKHLISLGRDIVVTDCTTEAETVYTAFHFKKFGPLQYVRLSLQRLDLLSPWLSRGLRFKKRWPILNMIAAKINWLSQKTVYSAAKAFYWLLCCGLLARIRGQRLRDITHDLMNGQKIPFETRPHFYRGPDVLNWMLKYPWVRDDVPPSSPPYHFSDIRQRFRYFAVEISTNDNPLGWVILSVSTADRRTVIKLLDYAISNEDYRALLWIVSKYARRFQADEIQLPSRAEQEAARLPLARWLLTRAHRHYACYRQRGEGAALPEDLQAIVLNFCDIDAAFT